MKWIVVADGDVYTLQAAGEILCKDGMRVTGLKTGQALMEFLKKNRPDMILLGDVLWELGGFEAISVLRDTAERGNELDILIMADEDNRDLEGNALAMGAFGLVDKPLSAETLLPRVRAALAMRKKAFGDAPAAGRKNLEDIAAALEKRTDAANGIWLGKEAFSSVYQHMLRYLERYHGIAFQVLFTVELPEDTAPAQRAEIMEQFRSLLQQTLRNSDIMLESGDNQVFLLLPEVEETDIGHVISRVISQWKQSEYGMDTNIASEVRRARLKETNAGARAPKRAEWIVVVDDDVANLKMAGLILSKQHMRVTALKSGQALLEYVKKNRPDLILLDVRMPDMDGFETMRLLKRDMMPGHEIPVIFLTADDNAESEMKGLALGAMDFIRKPFVSDVLTLRVKHIIELVKLQKNLAADVEFKTQENENLSIQLVQSLAEAIDAKDAYTNGHSGRVAEYAKEIARRYGYSRRQQDEIYMMGLLHDVGKIGVPDFVINKPDKLTDGEYAQIQTHPVVGDRILKNIREKPKLAVGARWHHERYDGSGYPDGLAGDEIPEEARIIAVADAYDAMTSRRSYRDILPQEKVKREIESNIGTQFDPVFAKIMLEIIAEDPDYRLREK